MEERSLRLLIRQKLRNGALPYDHIPRVWGGPGSLEKCDACEATIGEHQILMEGIALEGGRKPVQMHVTCFSVWDEERRTEDSGLPGEARRE
jgi:hypothetical protein